MAKPRGFLARKKVRKMMKKHCFEKSKIYLALLVALAIFSGGLAFAQNEGPKNDPPIQNQPRDRGDRDDRRDDRRLDRDWGDWGDTRDSYDPDGRSDSKNRGHRPSPMTEEQKAKWDKIWAARHDKIASLRNDLIDQRLIYRAIVNNQTATLTDIKGVVAELRRVRDALTNEYKALKADLDKEGLSQYFNPYRSHRLHRGFGLGHGFGGSCGQCFTRPGFKGHGFKGHSQKIDRGADSGHWAEGGGFDLFDDVVYNDSDV